MTEYYSTLTDGWTTAQRPLFPPDTRDLGDALFDAGSRILARSGQGRCGVGSFQVWSLEPPAADWPHYAVEIAQMDAESVVWIEDLPALWEFLRLYGGVGWHMCHPLPGEEHDVPDCPDCGEPMTRVPQEPYGLRPWQTPEIDA